VKLREISALISAGCGLEGAARYVGCAASTIRREARRNPDFNEQLRRAHLAAELGPLNAMRNAANTHWRAAAWLLERTNAQRFAKQNARHIKPEHLQQFTEMIGNLVQEEVADPNARRRISRRLNKIIKQSEAASLAAELDPCPTRRTLPRFKPG
jgi:IS30 family transposase